MKISRPRKQNHFPYLPEMTPVHLWVYFLSVIFLCHPLLWDLHLLSSFWLKSNSLSPGVVSASLNEKIVKMFPALELLTLLWVWGWLGLSCKESACQCRRLRSLGLDPWLRRPSWRRRWQPIPVFLPGKSHGQRILESSSLWGCIRVRHN